MAKVFGFLLSIPWAIGDAIAVANSTSMIITSNADKIVELIGKEGGMYFDGMRDIQQMQSMQDKIMQLLEDRRLEYRRELGQQVELVQGMDASNAKLLSGIDALKSELYVMKDEVRNLTIAHRTLKSQAVVLAEELRSASMAPGTKLGLHLLSMPPNLVTAVTARTRDRIHELAQHGVRQRGGPVDSDRADVGAGGEGKSKKKGYFLVGFKKTFEELKELGQTHRREIGMQMKRKQTLTAQAHDLLQLKTIMLAMKDSIGQMLEKLHAEHAALQEEVYCLENAIHVNHKSNMKLLRMPADAKVPVFR